MRRIAPNVRALGWSVSFDEREPDPPRRKIIVIEKAAPAMCPTYPMCPGDDVDGHIGHITHQNGHIADQQTEPLVTSDTWDTSNAVANEESEWSG